ALSALLDACAAAGAIRTDISPTDMGAVLEGVALTSGKPEQREQAERLIDLALDGLRYGAAD
ncbi:TetR/AcrR family transcriptional regulator, partial [Streptomyces sp. TRM76130]|nr:TetR/AcrR family transcriptional regulator [Streptomyces sp. TRM76130]